MHQVISFGARQKFMHQVIAFGAIAYKVIWL
jgi:hypothetical protein